MQQLLTKIRQSTAANKCALAAEAHARLSTAIASLETRATDEAKPLDFRAADKEVDEFEEVLEALEFLLLDLTTAEAERIKQTLGKDYADSIQTLTFYELLNPDGLSYTGDYAEFTNQKFTLPTKPEILSLLTPKKLKLYQKMEQQRLEPKLWRFSTCSQNSSNCQITPIAFQIRTLAQKLDAKKEGEKNARDTYISEGIKDADLQYSPTSITASPDGKQIEITGGQTKSEWIRAHGGFKIDIVATKPEVPADPEIQFDTNGQGNYNAVQAEKYATKLKKAGLTPMSYETYLLAQMQAIKAGNPLEIVRWSLLLDSNLKDSHELARGRWNADRVNLSWGYGDFLYDLLLLRPAVNVS